MGTIAKGEITLSPVNDAYTVLLTPSSCSISADFDGSNPNLTNAKGSITVKRGTKIVPFKVNHVTYSASGIKASWSTQEVTVMPFVVTQIPNTVLDGYIKFHITTQDGFNYSTEVQFSFNIVRESTMLDWIQDWEGSKTKVGGTYIMTPKLFVGKKEAVLDMTGPEPTWKEGALTGVYIGPDLLASGESSVGIYGYLKDEKIFHINADGGFIGGWTFNEGGLQSANGIVNILSEGSIYAKNPDSEIPYWGIYANGAASFANGNVKFLADGSAEFAGKITSISGVIGGWAITKNQLCSGRIFLDSSEGLIGINASKIQLVDELTGDYIFPETPDGGLKLWYNSATDFGMAGWTTGEKVFQLGSTNFIAGWSFNHQAIWTGAAAPSLTQGGYTSDSNALTIATNGIRSSKWYVDSNGTASFVGGSVKFNTDNAEMFGWLMRNGRFSSKHAALISSDHDAGVYVSVADISEVSGVSLRSTISNNGGIYLYSDGVNSIMRAYDISGNVGFSLRTTGYNTIAGWSFDSTAIYIGSKNLSQESFTPTEGAIVLSPSGIFGYKWNLLADGSGALAGGKIYWDKDGNITVNAKISANNITAGTISTADITNEAGTWRLNQDGSGVLANGNVIWDLKGNVNVLGSFSQKLHYAYKSDAKILSIIENESREPDVTLILKNQLYLVTNIADWDDNKYKNDGKWPYEIKSQTYYTIYLPASPSYIGKEVKIYDCNFGPFSRQPYGWCDTVIRVDGGNSFATKITYDGEFTKSNLFTSIRIRGGYVSFVGVPGRLMDGSSNTEVTMWICTDFYGSTCIAIDTDGHEHDLNSNT